MGIAPSSMPPQDDGPCDAATVAARQRSFEFFESLDPGRTFRWTGHAYFMYKRGGGVERARPVFRAALARCADYAGVYGAWVSMEMRADPAAAREVLEEWRARSEADGGGGEAGQASLWTNYVLFELEHGGAGRARAVAAAAAAACPRNVEVRAQCVLVEVRLGDEDRARAALSLALDDFADDEEARAQLRQEVQRGVAYLREREQWSGSGGCLHLCRGGWFRPSRWWELAATLLRGGRGSSSSPVVCLDYTST